MAYRGKERVFGRAIDLNFLHIFCDRVLIMMGHGGPQRRSAVGLGFTVLGFSRAHVA